MNLLQVDTTLHNAYISDMTEQPNAPELKIILPRLLAGELFGLAAFCRLKIRQGSFDVPARWLLAVLNDELSRRSSEANEAGSFSLPCWTNCELSEALLFTYILSRHGLTLGAAEFVDELFKHILSSAVSTLALLGEMASHG